jgi:hypothetical protein
MASQLAEKVGVTSDFGWRSGSPEPDLILGGAAVYRCGNCIVLNSALAAEDATLAQKRLFPQPLQRCRKHSREGQTSVVLPEPH